MWSVLLFIALVVVTACSSVAMGESKPNLRDSIEKFQYETALGASQGAIGGVLSDLVVTNSVGEALSVGDFRGKPLVLSLIYTSCHAVCPITTRHLYKAIEKARDALGADNFSVAVLGFDDRFDSPQAMQQYARKQGIDNSGWHLLSADEGTIDKLTEELGFVFFSSPNGFDHIVQASIIDADGRVYRQVYGETFETPLLVDPLLESGAWARQAESVVVG